MGSRKLCNIRGTKVTVHWSFLIILIYVPISSVSYEGINAGITVLGNLLIGFACILILLISNLLVTQFFGYKGLEIQLLPIGGFIRTSTIKKPKDDILISLAGPLSNLCVALILWGSITLISNTDGQMRIIQGIMERIVLIALQIGLLNLLTPALPLAGGRILRAALSIRYPFPKATQYSIDISRFAGVLLILIGFGINLYFLIIAAIVLLNTQAYSKLTYGAGYQNIQTPLDAKNGFYSNIVKEEFPNLTYANLYYYMLEKNHENYLVWEKEGLPIGVIKRETIFQLGSNNPEEKSLLEAIEFKSFSAKVLQSISDLTAYMQMKNLSRILMIDLMDQESELQIITIHKPSKYLQEQVETIKPYPKQSIEPTQHFSKTKKLFSQAKKQIQPVESDSRCPRCSQLVSNELDWCMNCEQSLSSIRKSKTSPSTSRSSHTFQTKSVEEVKIKYCPMCGKLRKGREKACFGCKFPFKET